MECVYENEGGKLGDIIIRDPYLFPAAQTVRGVIHIAVAVLHTGVIVILACLFKGGPVTLKRKICYFYLALAGIGSAVEGAATLIFTEKDGSAMALIARAITITSLGPLLVEANGMGESLWPSKHWESVWILSILYLLGSLAGFLTASSLSDTLSLLLLACFMGLGALYSGGSLKGVP
ncbi:unnamed protein product [Symbiodinium sp. CCMP2592]|nr:unnamed protein product [Symbiodinium sp. CCMP2592]